MVVHLSSLGTIPVADESRTCSRRSTWILPAESRKHFYPGNSAATRIANNFNAFHVDFFEVATHSTHDVRYIERCQTASGLEDSPVWFENLFPVDSNRLPMLCPSGFASIGQRHLFHKRTTLNPEEMTKHGELRCNCRSSLTREHICCAAHGCHASPYAVLKCLQQSRCWTSKCGQQLQA